MKKIIFLLILFAGTAKAQIFIPDTGWINKKIAAIPVGVGTIIKGDQGIQGIPGKDGINGKDGLNGKDGINGSGTGGSSDWRSIVNVKDFGALPTNPDNGTALQSAVDYAISNNIRTVVIPFGNYHTSKPLILNKWNGTSYEFFTLYLVGEGGFWDANSAGSNLIFDFKDKFGIGVQLGKGCKIIGIHIFGGFAPPEVSNYDFYHRTEATFTDSVSRDSRYSPYSGIVIDPFSTTVPPDGGYPGLTSWYRGNTGTAGSTGVEITDCIITGFVCGIITSPNGQTYNAELIIGNKIQFVQCKWCIVGTQSQEKENNFNNVHTWGSCYGLYTSGTTTGYGRQEHGNVSITNVNMAGRNVCILNTNAGGYFPSYFKDIYAETVGSVGFCYGDVCDNFTVDFSDYHDIGYKVLIDGTASFSHCTFRYLGSLGDMAIRGQNLFNDVTFSGTPFNPDNITNGSNTYINCKVKYYGGSNYLLGWQGIIINTSAFMYDGNKVLDVEKQLPMANINVTVNNNVATGTIPFGYVSQFTVGKTVNFSEGKGLGICTAINGNDVTISYCNPEIITGTYTLTVIYPFLNLGSFSGDITKDGSTINNVVGASSNLVGNIIYTPLGYSNLTVNTYPNLNFLPVKSVVGNVLTVGGYWYNTKNGAVFNNQ